MADLRIDNNPDASRFEVLVNGRLALLDYRIQGDTIFLLYVEVPGAEQGRGIASKLARAALEFARDSRLKVVGSVSFHCDLYAPPPRVDTGDTLGTNGPRRSQLSALPPNRVALSSSRLSSASSGPTVFGGISVFGFTTHPWRIRSNAAFRNFARSARCIPATVSLGTWRPDLLSMPGCPSCADIPDKQTAFDYP